MVGLFAGICFLYAQWGVSCDVMRHGSAVESFVQRISCARQALHEQHDERAFALMAPIYRHALGGSQSSMDKLSAIVSLKLPPELAQTLISEYGESDVYAAIVDAYGINPLTGALKKNTIVLSQELVSTVRQALPKKPAVAVSLAPAQGQVPVKQPRSRVKKQNRLQQARTKKIIKKEAPVRVSETEKAQAAQTIAEENVRLFAVNSVLDLMFITALMHNDQYVCQNLIAGVGTGNSFQVIRTAVQSNSNEAMYQSLKTAITSWSLFSWFRAKPATKSREELLGEWIAVIPAPMLVEQLVRAGIPDHDTIMRARAYLKNYELSTLQFRLSKAIMLMRLSYRTIFDPVRGVPFAVSTDERFGQIADIYLALNRGLLSHTFKISDTTQFTVQVPFSSEIMVLTLEELDKRLGEIVATLTVDILVGNKGTVQQRSMVREALIKAAKIGGILAVGATVVYLGYRGLSSEIAQSAIKKGGNTLLNYLSPLGAQISGAFGYVGAQLSYLASYIPGVTAVRTTTSNIYNIIQAVNMLGPSIVDLAQSIVSFSPIVIKAASFISERPDFDGPLVERLPGDPFS
jgi:hypothetical protein